MYKRQDKYPSTNEPADVNRSVCDATRAAQHLTYVARSNVVLILANANVHSHRRIAPHASRRPSSVAHNIATPSSVFPNAASAALAEVAASSTPDPKAAAYKPFEEFAAEVVAVIDAAGGSMLASRLPAAYQAKYGRALDFKALGFASMSALAPRIPGVSCRTRTAKRTRRSPASMR